MGRNYAWLLKHSIGVWLLIRRVVVVVGWGGVAYRWKEEERRLLYGINGHSVRLCGRREGRGDGLLHGGCGGGGGWLGETTVAGERERRVREGGRLGEAADIHEDGKCFFGFLSPWWHTASLQRDRGRRDYRRGRRCVKARWGPAHLFTDLEAIKVSVFLFLHTAARLCVSTCVSVWHISSCACAVRHDGRDGLMYAWFQCLCVCVSVCVYIYILGCSVKEEQAGCWAAY